MQLRFPSSPNSILNILYLLPNKWEMYIVGLRCDHGENLKVRSISFWNNDKGVKEPFELTFSFQIFQTFEGFGLVKEEEK